MAPKSGAQGRDAERRDGSRGVWLTQEEIDAAIDARCAATRPKKCSDLGQSTNVTKLYGAMFVTATP